jgi:AAA family ATP:ADP antiporter
MTADEKPPGFIYKIFRLFTVIHPGEGLTVFLLLLNIFLIMGAYSILKPLRKGLILTRYEASQEAYLYAAVAILLIFVIKIFSFLSSKIPRNVLIVSVTSFFISNLVLFYILGILNTPLSILGVVFWIWLSIFGVFVVAQFWGFSNDIYTEKAGKRLFPIILIGQSLGAYLGAKVTKNLVQPEGPLNVYQFMLLACAILAISIVLTIIIHKRELKRIRQKTTTRVVENEPAEKIQEKPLQKGGGFRLILKSRYLIFVAFMILMLNYVNTTGEYIRSDVWKQSANEARLAGEIEDSEEATVRYFTKIESGFNEIVNLLGMLIQLFLVSRIFKWFGVRGAVLFLPFIALGGYFLIGLGASFAVVRWTKTLENSTDYSLMNTTKGALFLITSREAKYKAKAAIDTFFVRTGDVLVALTVFIGTTYLNFRNENFARVNVVATVIWIIFCFLIRREHKRLSTQKAEYQVE